MRLIGLTGGISTGKTTVANYLGQTYNIPIWDADLYARAAVQPGSAILDRIVQRYGSAILQPDNQLNRQQLGKIIFDNLTERHWIEQQIHPFVRDRFSQEITRFQQQNIQNTAVLVIPLLFEAEMRDLVTEIWVVYCSLQQQLSRLLQRHPGSLTPQQAQARIDSQMSLHEKCQQADVILDNSNALETLFQQVDTALNSV
ncbi:MAG: dephospho-CoA kinase [Microcoleaceae cyanobacterium]